MSNRVCRKGHRYDSFFCVRKKVRNHRKTAVIPDGFHLVSQFFYSIHSKEEEIMKRKIHGLLALLLTLSMLTGMFPATAFAVSASAAEAPV